MCLGEYGGESLHEDDYCMGEWREGQDRKEHVV